MRHAIRTRVPQIEKRAAPVARIPALDDRTRERRTVLVLTDTEYEIIAEERMERARHRDRLDAVREPRGEMDGCGVEESHTVSSRSYASMLFGASKSAERAFASRAYEARMAASPSMRRNASTSASSSPTAVRMP